MGEGHDHEGCFLIDTGSEFCTLLDRIDAASRDVNRGKECQQVCNAVHCKRARLDYGVSWKLPREVREHHTGITAQSSQ
jgi:hypothetical protein